MFTVTTDIIVYSG